MKRKKTTCSICIKLGESIWADEIKGQKLPPEADMLVIIPKSDYTVRQCPQCGNLYRYEWRYDNDIFNRYDTEELTRITSEEAASIIEIEKRIERNKKTAIRKYARQVKKKHSAKLASLSDDELKIIDCIIEKTWEGEYHPNIVKKSGIDTAAINSLLDKLVDSGILSKDVIYPPVHGEDPETADVRWCTKYKING